GKLSWLLQCLHEIRSLDEKVLIFCVQKKLQEALSCCLGRVYGLSIPVINGDTKATSKTNPEITRLGLINEFSQQPGFGICVLSPIAAGAGLNIVAANHVIHLERHWNPAKEDQATDRVYRIGQTRPVRVYLPVIIHPDISSFDLVLYRLLEQKRGLQGALGLVPPDTVSGPELINELFRDYRDDKKDKNFVDLQSSLRFSWQLFEALIAVIYKIHAKQVILTPGGSDHGCDIVVLDWGKKHENLLIQCKKTIRSTLDSEVAVREVEGARPFYENALGISFKRRCLHTTANKFSRRTRNAAEICGVDLYNRSWLSEMLKKNKIEKSAVLAADYKREKAI
nr:restriction endonuclease [Deltaproteobacteria bacterium]